MRLNFFHSMKRFARKKSGFSLTAVTVLAMLVTLTIVGMGLALIPFYRSNATDLHADIQSQVIADSAANLALALLNDSASRADLDVDQTSPEKLIELTPAQLQLSGKVAANVQTILVVLRDSQPGISIVNPALIAQSLPVSYDINFANTLYGLTPSPTTSHNYWRSLSILIEYGSNGSRPYWKGYRLGLKPGLRTPGINESIPNPQSLFPSAVRASSSASLAEGANTVSNVRDFKGLGYVGADVSAGNGITLATNTSIGGKAQLGIGPSANINAANGASINEVVEYASATPPNIDPTVIKRNGPTAQYPTSTVFASQNVDSVPAATPAQAQTIPDATSLSNLPSGDYIIDASQASSLSITNIANPIRIFIESSSNSVDPITFPSNLGNSANPSNLQIWYNGKRPLNFNGSQTSALIFAPSSTVSVGSGIQTTTALGAIRGQSVQLGKNTSLSYNNSMKTAQPGSSYSKSKFQDDQTAYQSDLFQWTIESVYDYNKAEFDAEILKAQALK